MKVARRSIKEGREIEKLDGLVQVIANADLESDTYWSSVLALAGAGRTDLAAALQANAPKSASSISDFARKATLGVVTTARWFDDEVADMEQKIGGIEDPLVKTWAAIYAIERHALDGNMQEAYKFVNLPEAPSMKTLALLQFTQHFLNKLSMENRTDILSWGRQNLAGIRDPGTTLNLARTYLEAGLPGDAVAMATELMSQIPEADPSRPALIALRAVAGECSALPVDVDNLDPARAAETLTRAYLLARGFFLAEKVLPVPAAVPAEEAKPAPNEESQEAAEEEPAPENKGLTEDVADLLRACAREVSRECLVATASAHLYREDSSDLELINFAWILAISGNADAAEKVMARSFENDAVRRYLETGNIMVQTGHSDRAREYLDAFLLMPDLVPEGRNRTLLEFLAVRVAFQDLPDNTDGRGAGVRPALRTIGQAVAGRDLQNLSKGAKFLAFNLALEKQAERFLGIITPSEAERTQSDNEVIAAKLGALKIKSDTLVSDLEKNLDRAASRTEPVNELAIFLERAMLVGNYPVALEILRRGDNQFRILQGKSLVADPDVPVSIRAEALELFRTTNTELPQDGSINNQGYWLAAQEHNLSTDPQEREGFRAQMLEEVAQTIEQTKAPNQVGSVLVDLVEAGFTGEALSLAADQDPSFLTILLYRALAEMGDP